jgi:2-iminobutanoate/2-iminopropanoate deaminase
MKKQFNFYLQLKSAAFVVILFIAMQGCKHLPQDAAKDNTKDTTVVAEKPDYFLLRPTVEKEYGYSHAVKIGDDIKISGAVSMYPSVQVHQKAIV